MVLPTGQISMSEVNVELGKTSTALITLNDTAVRTLAGKASGAISMNDLRGKSASTVSSLTFNAGGVQTADGTTNTLNLSTGTANANRYIVTVIRYRTSVAAAGLPTLTVNGQSCSVVVSDTITTTRVRVAIYITNAPVTGGGTANFVLTAPSGTTLTSTFMASYSIISTGVTPSLIHSNNSVVPASTTVIYSPFVSGNYGIVMSMAATDNNLSDLTMSASGVATQNYDSGEVEFGILLSAKLIGSGNITFTSIGDMSRTMPLMAIWK